MQECIIDCDHAMISASHADPKPWMEFSKRTPAPEAIRVMGGLRDGGPRRRAEAARDPDGFGTEIRKLPTLWVARPSNYVQCAAPPGAVCTTTASTDVMAITKWSIAN